MTAPLKLAYGCHMSESDEDFFKTTVYLDADDYRRLREMAREQGTSAASLVRDAVSLYTRSAQKRRKPRSLGAGRSGRNDLSERVDELLRGMGEDK